jgi:hypothetical protein
LYFSTKQNVLELNRSFKVCIPIKPHLKKYLREFYTLPYVLNQKDDLGLFLYQLLRRRKFKDKKYFNIESCTDTLEVTISRAYALDHGCMLMNDYQTHLFNRYLEDMMIRHCITWVRACEMAGMNNRAAIVHWIEMYELDEGSQDWYHRIKKQYFRYRNWKKTQSIAVPAVPQNVR